MNNQNNPQQSATFRLKTTSIRPGIEAFLVGGNSLDGEFIMLQSGIELNENKIELNEFSLNDDYQYYFLVGRDILQPEY